MSGAFWQVFFASWVCFSVSREMKSCSLRSFFSSYSSRQFLPPCIRLHGWKCGQSDHLSCAAFKRTYERSNLKTYESYGPGKVGSGGRFPWRRISDQFTLFIHPEVCVDDSSFISLLKSPIYQKRVKCVVVDGAHLIKELFKCGLTYIKKLTK